MCVKKRCIELFVMDVSTESSSTKADQKKSKKIKDAYMVVYVPMRITCKLQ